MKRLTNSRKEREQQMIQVSTALGYDLEGMQERGIYHLNREMGYEAVIEHIKTRRDNFVLGFGHLKDNPIYTFCIKQFERLEGVAVEIYRMMN